MDKGISNVDVELNTGSASNLAAGLPSHAWSPLGSSSSKSRRLELSKSFKGVLTDPKKAEKVRRGIRSRKQKSS